MKSYNKYGRFTKPLQSATNKHISLHDEEPKFIFLQILTIFFVICATFMPLLPPKNRPEFEAVSVRKSMEPFH